MVLYMIETDFLKKKKKKKNVSQKWGKWAKNMVIYCIIA